MQQEIIVSAIGYNSTKGTGAEKYWQQVQEQTQDNLLITDTDPQKYLNNKGQKFLNRASIIYCNIAFQCIYQRNLQEFIEKMPDRVALYDSSELSNVEACFMFDLIAKNEGPDYVSPMNAPNTIANAAASQMAIQAAIKGPNVSVCAGAAGSLQSLDMACLHLKQGITDYAVIGSTEVINKYQTSIRKGEKRNTSVYSPELGAALLIEKASPSNDVKRLATIHQFASGTQLQSESMEDLVYRLIKKITGIMKETSFIDLLVISGGGYNLDEEALEDRLDITNFTAPIAYPEKEFGAGDNAGGILGIIYSIGIFNGSLNNIKTNIGILDTSKNNFKNIVVASVDMAGGASAILISNPCNQQ